MRRILTTALAVLAVAGAAAAPAGAAEPAPLQWGACPSPQEAALQCAKVPVPLDYRNPDGPRIEIGISRLASKNPAKRRGVLLINPGGPGLPGTPIPALLPYPQELRDSYDLIGIDPRGVGQSAPVTCNLTPEEGAVAANPPYPHSSADVAKQAEVAKTIANQCHGSKTAATLPFMTTANTARDMDRIRAALGEKKASYYGTSYGTYLGAVYTTLFPDTTDRVVLDSSLPPEGYTVDALRDQALGFQIRFPDFAGLAAANPAKYQLGSTPAQVTAKYFDLAARLDKTPVQGYDGTAFRAVTAGYIRTESTLGMLAELWHNLDTNQPTGDPEGTGAPYSDNFPAAYLAVACGDSRWPTSVRTYQRNVAADRLRYPMYGAFTANIRPCAFWPAPAEPKVRITGRGPANVLIVQNLRDPATPLPGALRMRAALGGRAEMVTIDQGGHTAYLEGPNKCGNDTVTDYLVTGDRTAHGAFCPAEPA
ncbi:alpha/beta hydrolase [Amycolatopsis endophytica]|uniref:Pimeloyl-ACP methyl ester carboxylesterase n=1 Tax=Amycolatopsis endophytica TaxID=860233 RepID=A0A853B1X4_9PSEU|nr:alpha/beta hydrolase [Amycolatopsis endophytica]NYI88852.1 pimeloyl-ACP methyl ester carboxylesterase [Amycolatopsis endophytica]